MSTQTATAFIPSWSLADRLRKARLVSGLTQREFANKIGVSAASYTQWECGNNGPRDLIGACQKIEAFTGVSSVWLAGFDPDRPVMRLPKYEPEVALNWLIGLEPDPSAVEPERNLLPHLDSNQEPSDSSFEKESDHGAEIFILRPECPDLPPNVYGQVAA